MSISSTISRLIRRYWERGQLQLIPAHHRWLKKFAVARELQSWRELALPSSCPRSPPSASRSSCRSAKCEASNSDHGMEVCQHHLWRECWPPMSSGYPGPDSAPEHCHGCSACSERAAVAVSRHRYFSSMPSLDWPAKLAAAIRLAKNSTSVTSGMSPA